jgi:ADP-ribosylglycohydrolase
MKSISIAERVRGAILGTIIGDALGLGPHWYADLDELKAEYGEWIDTYLPPKPNPNFPLVWKAREGLQAGDVSQTGQVFILLLESIAECRGYDEADFTDRLDDLLATLDGTPEGGRYTDEAMRDVWYARQKNVNWHHAGSFKDTAEAAIRAPLISALNANDRTTAFKSLVQNISLTHCDPVVIGKSSAFGMHIWMLINGIHLSNARNFTQDLRKKSSIPFSASINWRGKRYSHLRMHKVNFFDSMASPSEIWSVAHNKEFNIEPALTVCPLYGQGCRIDYLLTPAYYLYSRFENDFEMAVLSAINGGGNNMARAALTGALSGATVGITGIPERFISGLTDHERILELTDRVTDVI